MARTELDRTVQPSLLDRLTDEDPQQPADAPVSREESVRQFRRTVQRDVELLLNTRRGILPLDARHPQLRRSVHEFGLPDTTGLAMATMAARQRLTDDIRDTLDRFEPRLTNIVVRLTDSDQVRTPQVRFSIQATLRMDPTPEQVVFDTVLEMASGEYDVRGSA
ncbi:MAG: type VI secretion system baseplate subunit TssE [Gemmatimonas sp.]|jgi:type VI secretion system protein ImpF|uniref:type VI secretion system baseplate subunit TssE n=1 Tax=Gemmatimonas sp. TaxID=1962908 RepID=UPI00391FAC41|nr:type VI secretion system baseplate subunit TssE [Gemmatimonadota bacterium]